MHMIDDMMQTRASGLKVHLNEVGLLQFLIHIYYDDDNYKIRAIIHLSAHLNSICYPASHLNLARVRSVSEVNAAHSRLQLTEMHA